jgi:hypothetical protein
VRVQEVSLKTPLPLLTSATVPVGVLASVPVADPADSSVTAALQVVDVPTGTEMGSQWNANPVVRRLTVTVVATEVLVL